MNTTQTVTPQFIIRCPHATSNAPFDARMPDYHPLTRDELRALLTMAVTAENPLTSQIQVRLTQAIRGMVCPRPLDGDVAERENKIDSLYIETLNSNPRALPGLTDTFYSLMEGEG